MTYSITVSEIFRKSITVEADDETGAIQKAAKIWGDFDDNLDSPPLREVRFEAQPAD